MELRSDQIKKGIEAAPARSLLYATGQVKNIQDMNKPLLPFATRISISYLDTSICENWQILPKKPFEKPGGSLLNSIQLG